LFRAAEDEDTFLHQNYYTSRSETLLCLLLSLVVLFVFALVFSRPTLLSLSFLFGYPHAHTLICWPPRWSRWVVGGNDVVTAQWGFPPNDTVAGGNLFRVDGGRGALFC
jgi:hypothetical protein